jgi:hypothetical protein
LAFLEAPGSFLWIFIGCRNVFQIVVAVISIIVRRIRVDALALRLTPRNAPCGVTSGSGDRDDMLDESRRSVECVFKAGHSPHGSSNDYGNRFHPKIIEDDLVQSTR